MENQVDLIIHVRDLIFSSKVVSAAKAGGVAFKVVRDASKLLDVPGNRLIVDLNVPGAIQIASDWKAKFGGKVVGFVSHVAEETIDQAKQSGIDQVMSNGSFSARVDQIVMGS